MSNVTFLKPIPESIVVTRNVVSPTFLGDESFCVMTHITTERTTNGRLAFGSVSIYRDGFLVRPPAGPGIPWSYPWAVEIRGLYEPGIRLFRVMELAEAMTGVECFPHMETMLDGYTNMESRACPYDEDEDDMVS